MEPVRPESIQNVLEELYGAVKAKTGAETHVVAVDLVRSQKKLMVYQHGDYERKLFDDESTPESKYHYTDITKKNSKVHDYITSKLAGSSYATDMCAGINPEYTKEQIEDVELGFFVFGMAEREASTREYKPFGEVFQYNSKLQGLAKKSNMFKQFHGFVTCRVKRLEQTIKIDLICASLKGLGTQLMKTLRHMLLLIIIKELN